MTTPTVYEARPVKRRRRTNLELGAIDAAIMAALEEENPATLRGTYYRVVSAGAVDKTETDYKLVGRQVLKLRRSGVLPYSWITDGTRYVTKPRTWRSVDEMMSSTAKTYRRALWDRENVEVQVFVEKDAISGVVEPVTDELDVALGVLRGYASESFCWDVAASVKWSDRPVVFYQLGDHDPSGVDAWRNFAEKVQAFAPEADVTFTRLAVLPEQIVDMGLPTRPTKKTDTRAAGFEGESVEVDAIAPSILRSLLRDAIEQHLDLHRLAVTRMVEDEEKNFLRTGWGGGR